MKNTIYILIILFAALNITILTNNSYELENSDWIAINYNLQDVMEEAKYNHTDGDDILQGIISNSNLFSKAGISGTKHINHKPVSVPTINTQTNNKGRLIMTAQRSISNTELKRKRVLYYAAKRKVDSREDKRTASINVIKTGKKERVKVNKQTKEKTVVVVKLTDAQIIDEKRILAEIDLELEKAKDDLKLRDFGFSKAVKNQTDNILTKKQAYLEKKAEEKIDTVKALVNSAVRNSSLQNVLDLQKLSGEGGKINAVRSELMKIVRKENKNGYPIRNVSHKTVEIIMAGLLNWNTESSDQPFDVS